MKTMRIVIAAVATLAFAGASTAQAGWLQPTSSPATSIVVNGPADGTIEGAAFLAPPNYGGYMYQGSACRLVRQPISDDLGWRVRQVLVCQ